MKVGDKVYHRDTPDKVATIMSATIKKKKALKVLYFIFVTIILPK